MITYTFTNTGSDSLYEYLYKCIKNDILQGNIRAGEKLPSKRTFAKNLGISVITVENAYEQLIAEGYIYSIPKKGFYVTDLKKEVETEKKTVTKEMVPITGGESGYFADFTSNQTQSELFPFTVLDADDPGSAGRKSDPADDESSVWGDLSAAGGYCQISERIPRNDGAAGADHYRRRHRVSVWPADPAAWDG